MNDRPQGPPEIKDQQANGISVFTRLTLPLSGVNFLNQAARALIATVGPLLALEFSLSATELGLLAATFFASYALAQLPVGLAMDLFGVRRVQGTLATIAAIGFALCAASSGIIGLAVGRFITGIGISVGMIAMLTAHSQWLPRHRVAAMTGIGIFVASFGGMAATLPTYQLIPLVGWQGVFWLLAVLALSIAIWIFFSVPEPPGRPRRQATLAAELAAFGRIFRHRAFLRFAPAIMLLSGLNFTYGGLWAGPWLRDVGGFANGERATLLMVYMGGMMAGSLLTGQIASFLHRRGFDAMTVPYFCLLAIWLLQITLILRPSGHPAAIGALWFGFSFVSAAGPAGYSAVAQRFPPEVAGRIGTALNFTMLVFVFILQNVIGWVLDLWPRTAAGGWNPVGYDWAMGLTVLLQAMSVVWLLLPIWAEPQGGHGLDRRA
ncbi:MAG: MFS transporter [Acetobacteraceae bacterium]